MFKLGLVVGHSEKSQGAVNKASGVTEWRFNGELVSDIGNQLYLNDWRISVGDTPVTVEHPHASIFVRTSTISDLVNRINEWGADLCIEFHCNAFNGEVSGTEMLLADCHKPSPVGGFFEYVVGLCFHVAQSIHPLFPDRLNKLVSPKKNIFGRYKERGAYFLWETNCRAIIAESFFIDNDSDLTKAEANKPALVKAYADWIINYANEQ